MNSKIKIDPKVKDVLKLLAAGAIITTVVLFPGIAALGLASQGLTLQG